jgi:hypothetical protein
LPSLKRSCAAKDRPGDRQRRLSRVSELVAISAGD